MPAFVFYELEMDKKPTRNPFVELTLSAALPFTDPEINSGAEFRREQPLDLWQGSW